MKRIQYSLSVLCLIAFTVGVFPFSVSAAPCSLEDFDGDQYRASASPSSDTSCDTTTISFKGYEKKICDCPNLSVGARCDTFGVGSVLTEAQIEEIIDPNKVSRTLKGRSFNPKATDAPDDGIDQDCDGKDGSRGDLAGGQDIASLVEKGVQVLGSIVAGVSTLFLIWGAVMYASASGEEEKTSKARKTMTGAMVGLVIGVLAATLIGMVINLVIG